MCCIGFRHKAVKDAAKLGKLGSACERAANGSCRSSRIEHMNVRRYIADISQYISSTRAVVRRVENVDEIDTMEMRRLSLRDDLHIQYITIHAYMHTYIHTYIQDGRAMFTEHLSVHEQKKQKNEPTASALRKPHNTVVSHRQPTRKAAHPRDATPTEIPNSKAHVHPRTVFLYQYRSYKYICMQVLLLYLYIETGLSQSAC